MKTNTIKETIQITEKRGGKIVYIHVYGKLSKLSYQSFMPAFDRLVKEHGKLRVLFDLAGFEGWTVAGAWEDLRFSFKHYDHLERIAIVGDHKWKSLLSSLTELFTAADVEFFLLPNRKKAEQWLEEDLPER